MTPQRPALIASLLTVGVLAAGAVGAVAWVERSDQPPAPAGYGEAAGASRDEPALVRVAGSGSNVPLTQILATAFNARSAVRVEVLPSIGSAGGLRALEDGIIDVALVSRPLTPGELGELVQVPYARAQIVVATRLDLSGMQLDIDALSAIYGGELTRTARGERIVPILREEGDSTFAALAAIDTGFAHSIAEAQRLERFRRVLTDPAMEHVLSTVNGTLGLLDAGFVHLHPTGLRGVPIGSDLGANYPYTKDLALVYSREARATVEAFVSFAGSEQGRELIQQAHYSPLPEAPQ